ncbi:aminotransferase class V-fold PLP-dependent enzyme [Sphingomicrobium flavum]|uniref:aminotransferase class V-fold PLP-dependent enzyme n=1 Tax=Sphingomicrobium flavum TaxID=1229164 RepID=UPI0021AD962E|nr:aminotransferase class V-fold PLP-dependent enzyme [Sphingomicrobium flavum]
MSFKPLFIKSLMADQARLHFAAHSHHLWPDASLAGQLTYWNDSAKLADRKWDKVMGDVWPTAQAHVGDELGGVPADRIVFAANTHDFIVRLAAAVPQRFSRQLHILTTDGEFHSLRRQLSRWLEEGSIRLEAVPVEPFDSFADRFLEAAQGDHDLIFTSHTLFGSGRIVPRIEEIVALSKPEGPWVVVDGYHSFMALETPFPKALSDRAFYLGGGYKYAMAGEGMGFMVCPPGFGERPPLTGWFAEFEDLTLPPGMIGYAEDAMRFMGATFDPSSLYRFNAVRAMLTGNRLDTAGISARIAALQAQMNDALAATVFADAELLNPLDGGPHARFLAYRHPDAARWCGELMAGNVITDVRGDVIRLGFGLYHDEEDVDLFAKAASILK